ncbi:CvpA family protein [Bacillus tianshenii]|nr:CvpA family protein [Bacillus tianshenii]
MVDLIILILLAGGFFVGFQRGFVLQIVHIVGFILSFVVAYMYFDDLTPHVRLWIPYPNLPEDTSLTLLLDTVNAEMAYYRAISFAILFFGTKIVMQIIGTMLDFLADLPLLSTVNGWLGGALGLVEVYLFLFFLLYVGALVPLESVQTALNQSVLAQGMVEHTPVFSEKLKDLWFEHYGVTSFTKQT